jgi:hypothetical protein
MESVGRSMTITWRKFMGGYQKIILSAPAEGDVDYHITGPLGPRFMRVYVYWGGTDGTEGNNRGIVLPDATNLPLIPGGPAYTIFNPGFYNCDLKDYSGTVIGCIPGWGQDGEHGTHGCRTSVYLISNTTQAGTWRIDCHDCASHTGVTTSHTGTVTVTDETTDETGTGTHGSGTGSGTATQVTLWTEAAAPKPLPFTIPHPEIPIPAPVPLRPAAGAEEGI